MIQPAALLHNLNFISLITAVTQMKGKKVVLKINDEMSDLYLICWWSGQRKLDVSVQLNLADSFDRTPMC